MVSRLRVIILAAIGLVILLSLSIAAQLEIPKPTGPYIIGRTSRHWVDTSRLEVLTDSPDDFREAPVQIWYPAEPGTGASTTYFPKLDNLASALVASGEVTPFEAFGLRFIRSHERLDAQLAGQADAYPVILHSAGNGTNVEFYAALAGELASHGYIVVGLNHPYDVAAVALHDGRIARFVPGPPERETRHGWVTRRIVERTADVRFVLDQLEALNTGDDPVFGGRLDLTRVGAMGHSLGGIAAAQACLRDSRLGACLNFDGLQQGGPFSTDLNPAPPKQPFMMITKEERLHPAMIDVFEATPSKSYLVSIKGASHENFTDGPLLLPALLPLPKQAEQVLALTRAYMLAFFEKTISEQASSLLEEPMQGQDAKVDVYPSH